MATLVCVVCKTEIGDGSRDGERFVLLRGRREEVHCSQVCLVANVERRRLARAAVRRRWLLRATAVAVIVVGAPELWHRVRLPQTHSISFDPPEYRPPPEPRPEPLCDPKPTAAPDNPYRCAPRENPHPSKSAETTQGSS